METRIAVLEHIAKTAAGSLERLERMLERMARRFDALVCVGLCSACITGWIFSG